MKLCVYDIEGKKTSEEIELNPLVFGVEPSKHLLYQAVKTYLANQREGNAKAKRRSETNYSTAKLLRQKGTGGARRGDRKSPLLVGGGKTFAPAPRSYFMKMNKKQRLLARRSAYTVKAQQEEIRIIDNFEFETPKTSRFNKVLSEMGIIGKKVLVLVDSYSYLDDDKKYDNAVNLIKSARNLKNVNCQLADAVSTYELMRADFVVIQKEALKTIDRING